MNEPPKDACHSSTEAIKLTVLLYWRESPAPFTFISHLLLFSLTYYPSPVMPSHSPLPHLLPVGRQNRLHVLRPLINRLIPGQAGLLTE